MKAYQKSCSSDYSSRLQTAEHLESLYHSHTRAVQLPKLLKADLKTFETLVLRQGLVVGLDEMSVLRKKYRHLQRGDRRPVLGEKHPLLALQDARAMSPKLAPGGLRKPRPTERWVGPTQLTRAKVEEQQWRENCDLLQRWLRR